MTARSIRATFSGSRPVGAHLWVRISQAKACGYGVLNHSRPFQDHHNSYYPREARMGVELRPVFRPTLREAIYQAEGKALVDDLEMLEEIAAERGLPPLTAFMDPRQPPDDFEPDENFDGDPDTYLDQACGPWTNWFPAKDGLTAFQGLLAAVQDPATRAGLSDAETVIFDLEELVRSLKVAATKNAQFRLEVC